MQDSNTEQLTWEIGLIPLQEHLKQNLYIATNRDLYHYIFIHTNTNTPPDSILASACRFSTRSLPGCPQDVTHCSFSFAPTFLITTSTGCGVDAYLYGNAGWATQLKRNVDVVFLALFFNVKFT